MSCGVGCRRGSDPALLWLWLWLWRRLVATAPIQPLAWEPPYAAGAAQEMAKRQKNKKTKKTICLEIKRLDIVKADYKSLFNSITFLQLLRLLLS